MSGTTISNLPAAGSALATDLVPVVEVGSPDVTKRVTVTQLLASVLPLTGGTISGALTVNGNLGLLNNVSMQIQDSGAVARSVLNIDGSNNTNLINGGGALWRVLNKAQNSALISMTDAGVVTFTGAVHAGSNVQLTNNIALQILDTGATARSVLVMDASNNTNLVNGGGALWRVLNQAQNSALISMTDAGVATFVGPISCSAATNSGAISGWSMTAGGTAAFGPAVVPYAFIANGANMLATGYYATSDERLKVDIAEITPEAAQAWLDAARPVTYRKKARHDDPDDAATPEAGFIAQDQVRAGYSQYVGTAPHEGMPERADGDFVWAPDVMLTLNPAVYVAYLTAALKDALRRIAALEQRLAP